MGVAYIFTDNSSSDLYTSEDVFDRTIYRKLSMQDNMKTVDVPVRVTNEFDVFLNECEKLTNNETVSDNFIAFNNYLGSLGIE